MSESNENTMTFEKYKFAREILSKEIEYRREKQWKLFSWASSILIGITGGIIALSGKGFTLSLLEKVLLIGAVIVLTVYTCVWVHENWKKANDAKDNINNYDEQYFKSKDEPSFRPALAEVSNRAIVGTGYLPTIFLLALAASMAIFIVPQRPSSTNASTTSNNSLNRSAN